MKKVTAVFVFEFGFNLNHGCSGWELPSHTPFLCTTTLNNTTKKTDRVDLLYVFVLHTIFY